MLLCTRFDPFLLVLMKYKNKGSIALVKEGFSLTGSMYNV